MTRVLYHKYHDWIGNNISAVVKVVQEDEKILVYVNGKDKTHVKEEVFKTINWRP